MIFKYGIGHVPNTAYFQGQIRLVFVAKAIIGFALIFFALQLALIKRNCDEFLFLLMLPLARLTLL